MRALRTARAASRRGSVSTERERERERERDDRNNALAEHDATDEVVRLHTFNRVYSYAYDGATIWQYMPERKFD
jgi:hypothetical protein